MNREPIHSFLMSGELKPMYKMCIRSFQKHGHPFILYTFLDDLDVECEKRDLREIITENKIFWYKNMPENLKHGGIGERITSLMLNKLGGWHVNLDVTCLQPFDFETPYVFRPHQCGIVANMIKAEKESEFTKKYVEYTSTITENETDYERSIKGLYPAAKSLGLDKYIVGNTILGRDEDEYWMPFYTSDKKPPVEQKAIHWCNGYGRVHSENSFYEKLLKEYECM